MNARTDNPIVPAFRPGTLAAVGAFLARRCGKRITQPPKAARMIGAGLAAIRAALCGLCDSARTAIQAGMGREGQGAE